MSMLEAALEKITAQQPEGRTPVWMVGEQLKDMLRAEPRLAEIVAQDLDVKEMSLAECEKKIKEFADKHKTGRFSCVIPSEADRIIRAFYGLPSPDEAPVYGESSAPAGNVIHLEDFFLEDFS